MISVPVVAVVAAGILVGVFIVLTIFALLESAEIAAQQRALSEHVEWLERSMNHDAPKKKKSRC